MAAIETQKKVFAEFDGNKRQVDFAVSSKASLFMKRFAKEKVSVAHAVQTLGNQERFRQGTIADF